MGVALEGEDGEVAMDAAVEPSFAVDHHGVLADGHAVDDGYGVHAHEGAEVCGVEHGAVDIVPVGVGAVEQEEWDVLFGAGLHDVVEGRDIGVEAASHILQVEDDDVDALELCGCRLFVLAVEGDDGEPCCAVGGAGDVCSCRLSAAESVFGAEDLHHVDVVAEECVDEVGVAAEGTCHQGGVVGDEGYFFSGKRKVERGVWRVESGKW